MVDDIEQTIENELVTLVTSRFATAWEFCVQSEDLLGKSTVYVFCIGVECLTFTKFLGKSLDVSLSICVAR